MASMDMPTLEYFVRNSFRPLRPDQEQRIVALLEPERASIEEKMSEDYDPDEHSWRDYRNSLWYGLVDYNDAIEQIVAICPIGLSVQ